MDADFSDRLRSGLMTMLICPTCHNARWSLSAVSRASGIHRRTLHRFLSGQGQLRLATVDKLLAFLHENGVTVRP